MRNGKKDRERALAIMAREKVKFLHLSFVDIRGISKTVVIPAARAERAFEDGVVFDGSSVVGYATADESDMRAHPIPTTLQVLPWIEDERSRSARIMCEVYTPSGQRFEGDPRWVLEKVVAAGEEMGYRFMMGPEYEFFLFNAHDSMPTVELSDRGGYFDLMPQDRADIVRKQIMHYLNQMGMDAEASHHEVSPSQHEVDVRYTDALRAADQAVLLKQTVKNVALGHGLYATFMPKPIHGVNGSGMHVHQSMMDPKGQNLFAERNVRWKLSELATRYLAGVLSHAKEMCPILASWVNSYKRLVPGFEAPVYICWANMNRTALVRVPAGRGMSTRIEVRCPDPAGNPYLQFAVMLAAGLDGIRKRLDPPDPVEKDIYHMDPEERLKLGIESLPESLGHSLAVLRESKFMRTVLGDHVVQHFLTVKGREWDDYRTRVTPWEVESLLPIL